MGDHMLCGRDLGKAVDLLIFFFGNLDEFGL